MSLRSQASITSAALCVLFLLVYPTCNWVTSHRDHIGSWYFSWERHLPFVPLLIIPYMSIDLFFVGAPFLARSERELRMLSRRLGGAIIIAGICFLLFPLRFAFDRPNVTGPMGAIFNYFRQVDLPYNQCPSLHIVLWTILLDTYLRRTSGICRVLVACWFSLIFISTILTYQHHVIDVLGGVAAAALCFYLFRDQPLLRPFIPNYRIAFYYGIAAAILLALGFGFTPWSYFLLWPAGSLVVVAAAYIALGPGIYCKEGGRIPYVAWLILWPALLGQRLSLVYYAQRCGAYDRLTEKLWIGRKLSSLEARQARDAGVTAVLDLTGEFSKSLPFRDLNYLNLPVLDLTAPAPDQIDQAIDFIQSRVNEGIVYVHCKVGYSRTAVIAGAYLLQSGQAASVEVAVEMLRKARPSIVIRPEARAALTRFAEIKSPHRPLTWHT